MKSYASKINRIIIERSEEPFKASQKIHSLVPKLDLKENFTFCAGMSAVF